MRGAAARVREAKQKRDLVFITGQVHHPGQLLRPFALAWAVVPDVLIDPVVGGPVQPFRTGGCLR